MLLLKVCFLQCFNCVPFPNMPYLSFKWRNSPSRSHFVPMYSSLIMPCINWQLLLKFQNFVKLQRSIKVSISIILSILFTMSGSSKIDSTNTIHSQLTPPLPFLFHGRQDRGRSTLTQRWRELRLEVIRPKRVCQWASRWHIFYWRFPW